MQKGLFVLNQELSGVSPFLFAALRRQGWDVRWEDVGLPLRARARAAAWAFHPRFSLWKRRYYRRLTLFARSDFGRAARTAYCERLIADRARPFDVIFTIGVTFDAATMQLSRPYVVFRDYTAALACRGDVQATDQPANEFQSWADHEAIACRRAALVFTASENTRRSVIEDYGVPADRVVCVGEGLCFPEVPALPVRKAFDEKTVLFVGKDFERKGGDILLAAFDRVRGSIANATLLVLGPPRPRFVPDGVLWLGLVTDRTVVRACYARSTVFAMPSRLEPFGLVFLEAMAYGLPCIGSKCDAMPEIIVNGTTGFLVEPGDVYGLAERIQFLLETPAEARRMGAQGHARVCERFLWSHVAQRMDERLVGVASSFGR